MAKVPVGGANSPHTSGDNSFLTPNLATLNLGNLFQFKNRPLSWHKQLLLLSKLAADLNRLAGYEESVLSTSLTLNKFHKVFQRIDPGGVAQNVTLPAEEITEATVFFLTNTGSAGDTITVKDDAGSSIKVLSNNESAWFYSDGAVWKFALASGGSGSGAGNQRTYTATLDHRMATVKQYLTVDGVVTSAVPILINKAGSVTGCAVMIDKTDPSNTFDAMVEVNGISSQLVTIASGLNKVSTTSLSIAIAAGDEIALFLLRTSGAGSNVFRNAILSVEFQES